MAITLCDSLITADIEPNCTDPIVAGIESFGVLVNRQDINFALATYDATRSNVLQNIPIKSGKRGYGIYVPSNQPFAGTATNSESGTIQNKFTNTFNFVIMDTGPDITLDVVDKLNNGEFVAIVENRYKRMRSGTTPGDATYSVYGWQTGLKISSIANDRWSADTDGGWEISLTETGVPQSGMYLFDTDVVTTKAIFDGLTTIQP